MILAIGHVVERFSLKFVKQSVFIFKYSKNQQTYLTKMILK